MVSDFIKLTLVSNPNTSFLILANIVPRFNQIQVQGLTTVLCKRWLAKTEWLLYCSLSLKLELLCSALKCYSTGNPLRSPRSIKVIWTSECHTADIRPFTLWLLISGISHATVSSRFSLIVHAGWWADRQYCTSTVVCKLLDMLNEQEFKFLDSQLQIFTTSTKKIPHPLCLFSSSSCRSSKTLQSTVIVKVVK